MNKSIIDNYSGLKPSLFFLPLFLLGTLVIYLFVNNALHVQGYIDIQKDLFYHINSLLSKYPALEYNLTQIGDALVFLSLLSVFLVYAPVLWESLISVSVITLIVSSLLKKFFAVPRPAAALNQNSFVIIGDVFPGHSSLPSGHSITIFTTLTVLLFAFMPKKMYHRFLWVFGIFVAGLFLAFTRVAVGAHYPLDVLVGSTVGYMSGLAGIFFARKYKIWSWISNQKYYPILFLLLLIAGSLLIIRISTEQLPIFFLALSVVIISLYKLAYVYFKK